MVNPDALGIEGTPFEMDVERGKIQEFATAVRSSHPAHMTGHEPVVPPTFLTTQFFWESRVPGSNPWERVEMDPKRGMHAEQEYVFHGPPPRAGTRLTCTSRIEQIYDKDGKKGGKLTFAVMVTEFRDAAGRLVAEGRLTGVETGKAPEANVSEAKVPEEGRIVTRAAPSWEAIEAGREPGPTTVGPITLTDVVRYQGASGDMNPIHHDPGFAAASGFEKPLVVGMFQAGVLTTWATDWLGPENVRRTKVRWKVPVWPGDVLTFSGKVAKKYEEDGERKVDVELTCTNQDGAVAVLGWMTFVVPS